MKIGQIVQNSIPAIFAYCEENDPAEFARLQDARYAKETFDINYPFCRQVAQIGPSEQVRYWKREYVVSGVLVRVTSQWFNPPTSKSSSLLQRYLADRGIAADFHTLGSAPDEPAPDTHARAARGRYSLTTEFWFCRPAITF